MRTKITASVLVAAIAVSSCANMSETEKKTTGGVALGAVAGAALGALTGPGGWTRAIGGAALGGLLGGGATYLWNRDVAKQGNDIAAHTEQSGVKVVKTEDNFIQISMPTDDSFSSGSSQLTPQFRQVLDKVAADLNSYKKSEIIITGHTDNTGTDEMNNRLSLQRASHVRDYLVSQGVDANRIRVQGLGSRYPVADNSTADGRFQNRRVEIFVGEKQA